MGIVSSRFTEGDVYVDYAFEEVLFRWEAASRRTFRKFYGQTAEQEVAFSNNLFAEALQYGEEVDRATYVEGKPPRGTSGA